MGALRPLLPAKYSPLLIGGRRSQSICLTELPRQLARALADLAGSDVAALARAESVHDPRSTGLTTEQAMWEERLRHQIEEDASLLTTTKEALAMARRTGTVSAARTGRRSSLPSIDHLFDRGFISFRQDGRLLVSPVAHGPSLDRMGLPLDRDVDTGPFTAGQGRFIEYHRDLVFLASRRRDG